MTRKNKQEMDRRRFLGQTSLAAGALVFPTPLRTLGTTKPSGAPCNTLVVIFLRGGQDALNTVIPYRDKNYHAIRPTIAIAPKASEGVKGVLQLDKNWGLHPSMAPLMPLWEAGQLAPVVCCGSPHPTRSHFDAQDFMEYAAPGKVTKEGGWLNRYLRLTAERTGNDSDLRAIAMQGLLPRSLRGAFPVLAVPERQARRAGEYLDLFDELYGEDTEKPGEKSGQKNEEMAPKKKRGKADDMMERDEDPVVSSGRATIETLRRYQEIVSRKQRGRSGRGRFPGGRLGPRLADIAKVINADAGLEIACVDWNGWDHHTGQGAEDGRHSRMMGDLSAAIAAFMQELGPRAQNTVVCTMTEFGRTCRENGNAGTDHGHGGMMLLAGGGLKGGKVYGRFPGLEDSQMYQGRDLQVTTDFRDVQAELLVKHLGVNKLPKGFFPDYRPARKGLGLFG